MKKVALLWIILSFVASCMFDAKDSCLDAGGSFDEQKKICVHNVVPEADLKEWSHLESRKEEIKSEDVSRGDNSEIKNQTKNIEWGSGNPITNVDYPVDLAKSPAAQICQTKWWNIEIVNENNTNVLYCQLNGKKLDAWKFFADNQ